MVARKDAQTVENPQYSLVEAYRDKLRTANSSWSDTDKLYVSVCSALVALAAIFGGDPSDPPLSVTLIGVLLLLLAYNWWQLVDRYRKKIGAALEGLANELDGTKTGSHFREEQKRFDSDRSDYRIVAVVFLVSLLMIIYPVAFRMIE